MSSINGFVHIVESPSSEDLLDLRMEGRSLSEVLSLSGVRFCYSLATDLDTLRRALSDRLVEAWKQHQLPPILHFSMHGSQDGVQLTSGDVLRWAELRALLQPLNQALNGGLLVCMSSCFGASGCLMAMDLNEGLPFWALVGNTHSPSWPDAAVAYITFYHLLFKGLPLEICVETMNQASADHNFMAIPGQKAQRSWVDHLQQQVASLSGRIQDAAAQVEKGP